MRAEKNVIQRERRQHELRPHNSIAPLKQAEGRTDPLFGVTSATDDLLDCIAVNLMGELLLIVTQPTEVDLPTAWRLEAKRQYNDSSNPHVRGLPRQAVRVPPRQWPHSQ